MNVADEKLVASFIQLANHFATGMQLQQPPVIESLTMLWREHGSMIAEHLRCDTTSFESSDVFYDGIKRRMMLVSGGLAEVLNAERAAGGDEFEICKFYALYLEELRKEHSANLIGVIESIPTSAFDPTSLFEFFRSMDAMYASDSTEDWFECLRSADSYPESFATPTRNLVDCSSYKTPAATTRRLHNASCVSPAAEAVNSPIIRLMRTKEMLLTEKKKRRDAQDLVDDMNAEIEQLKEENRQLKISVFVLKDKISDHQRTRSSTEQHAMSLQVSLEECRVQVDKLTLELYQADNERRTVGQQVLSLEAENRELVEKFDKINQSARRENIQLLKNVQDLEEELFAFRKKEHTLSESLKAAEQETRDVAEQLQAMQLLHEGFRRENEQLAFSNDRLSIDVSLSKRTATQEKSSVLVAKETIASLEQQLKNKERAVKSLDGEIKRLADLLVTVRERMQNSYDLAVSSSKKELEETKERAAVLAESLKKAEKKAAVEAMRFEELAETHQRLQTDMERMRSRLLMDAEKMANKVFEQFESQNSGEAPKKHSDVSFPTSKASEHEKKMTLRAEAFVIAEKNTYSPSATSSDRIGEVTARNRRLKPHLQSSYAVEMGVVSSPSASEHNVRKGIGRR